MSRPLRVHASTACVVTLPMGKSPTDVRPYRVDWGPFLVPLQDRVLTSAWDGGGLTVEAHGIEAGGLATFLWLSGGSEGTTYLVRNTVVTFEGRTVRRSFRILVEKR